MTDRERWTVYPLLFMTLGIAVKDKVVSRLTSDTVLCNTLIVQDRKGNEQIVISSTPSGGQMLTLGGENRWGVLVGQIDKLAGLMFVDSRGRIIRTPATIANIAVAPAGSKRAGPEPQESPQPPLQGQPPDEQPPKEQPPLQPERPAPPQTSPESP